LDIGNAINGFNNRKISYEMIFFNKYKNAYSQLKHLFFIRTVSYCSVDQSLAMKSNFAN